MKFQIQKATKAQAKARIALVGVSGSGKTWTALELASGLGSNIVVIDSENESSNRYADEFDFSILPLHGDYSPQTYIEAITYCEAQGFDVIVVDSLSHAWFAKNGALDQLDMVAKRTAAKSGRAEPNSFNAWKEITPIQNALLEKIVRCKTHLIATMRAKDEYVVEKDERGRSTPRKVGLSAIQRDGITYEFDFEFRMDDQHTLMVSKTRWSALDGAVIPKPNRELGERIRAWLSDGVVVEEPAEAPPPPPQQRQPVVRLATQSGKARHMSPRQADDMRIVLMGDYYQAPDKQTALDWAAQYFEQDFGKPLADATYEEASRFIESLKQAIQAEAYTEAMAV